MAEIDRDVGDRTAFGQPLQRNGQLQLPAPLAVGAKPEIFNTDQGSQFTSLWIGVGF